MIYKAVGFDYGGVLTGKPSSEIRHRVAKLLGLKPGEYEKVYYKYNEKVNLGLISWEELWVSVLKELNISGKYNELMTFFRQPEYGQLNQQVIELARNLRESGLKTGVLSNNSLETAKRMRQQGLGDYFDILAISCEIGFVKPDPRAFEYFADRLDVKLDELIFIDDSEKSLSTSPEVGYKPILFKDIDTLKDELSKLEVI